MKEILQFILIIASTILIIQAASIMHELGHAIPVLLFSRNNVSIVVGKSNERIMKIKLKRLTFIFRGFNFIFSATDYSTIFMKPKQQIAAFAGGPVVSFIFGESLSLISRIFSGSIIENILLISGYYFIAQFIVSIIPIIYPEWFGDYAGYPSDGYKIMTVIKNNKRER